MADLNQMDLWNNLIQSRALEGQDAEYARQMQMVNALRGGVGKKNYYGWLGGGLNAASDIVDAYNARDREKTAVAGKAQTGKEQQDLLMRLADLLYGNKAPTGSVPAPTPVWEGVPYPYPKDQE